jgi:hypothetical protein
MEENTRKFNYTEKNLMDLADTMAAAASSFNAHGYSMFIQARDELKDALHVVMADQAPNKN